MLKFWALDSFDATEDVSVSPEIDNLISQAIQQYA
jgi:hypothetical protein